MAFKRRVKRASSNKQRFFWFPFTQRSKGHPRKHTHTHERQKEREGERERERERCCRPGLQPQDELMRVAQAAQQGKLAMSDIQGGTITLSNIGVIGASPNEDATFWTCGMEGGGGGGSWNSK